MRAESPDVIDDIEAQKVRRKTVFLSRLQWGLNLLSGILSAVAIGFSFARLNTLAQLTLALVTVVVFGSVFLAYYRYKRNRDRREAIFSQLDLDRDTKLYELFEEAYSKQELSSNSETQDEISASLKKAGKTQTPSDKSPVENLQK